MYVRTSLLRRAITVIGFTGTIASGKTARCHRLVWKAINTQQSALRGDSSARTLTTAQVLQLVAIPQATPSAGAPPQDLVETIAQLPMGVKYINADLVGHSIYRAGTPCYEELLQHFGREILAPSPEGAGPADLPEVNRKTLGHIVFSDPAQLQALNRICWPHIGAAIQQHIRDAEHEALGVRQQRHLLLVVEAALMLEMGSALLNLCTDVWLTYCTVSEAVRRVRRRDGLGAEEAARRVASQSDLAEKQARLAEAGFTTETGNLELFNTSAVTLEEGLHTVDVRFKSFWEARLRPRVIG